MLLPPDSYAVVSSLPAGWLLQLARAERDRLAERGRRLAPVLESVIVDLSRAASCSDRRSERPSERFRAPIVEAMTTREAAAVLGITSRAVIGRIHRGTLRAERTDGGWLVDRVDVEARVAS